MPSDSSDSIDLIYVIIFVVVIIGAIFTFVKLSNKKTRGKTWTGIVLDKKVTTSTDEDNNVSHFYILKVEKDGIDKPKNVYVPEAIYNEIQIGDKIEKKLGELQPTKIA